MRFLLHQGGRLSLAVVAVACLCLPARGKDDAPKPVTVTDKENDGKVTLAKGQELIVRLVANPTTGFTWVVSKKAEKQLKQVGKPVVEKGTGRIGAPSKMVYRFKALKAGTDTLELHYLRTFEKGKKPAKTFKVKVTVK
jgi:predicted secreted protein